MPELAAEQVIHAAGAVVWVTADDGFEVAVIHRLRYDDWSFPKGKREPGEHLLETAVREVGEETGLTVILGRPLGHTSYEVRGQQKHVTYWSAVPREPLAGFAGNNEADKLEWLPLRAASGRLSYQRDRLILAELAASVTKTVPFIFVRHASAGRRSEWPGDDLARPLDPAGAADAAALGRLLACYGPARVITSPAERCIASLVPYAAATGAAIEIEPLFTAEPAVPEQAIADRAAQIVGQGRPAVICGHRENLPVLLAAACGELGSAAPDGPPLAKGGCWVLHAAGRRLIATERHHPAEG
jgi:8-oxo-dGTP diphosphatase